MEKKIPDSIISSSTQRQPRRDTNEKLQAHLTPKRRFENH